MQGVELTGTNRSCGLVVLLFHLLRSKSIRPGSSAASAARHDTFACAYAKGSTFSGGYIGRQSSHRTGWCPMQSPTFSGGYIGGVPPVPIPNTAVKPSRADGTARFPCGRVGRCRNFSQTPRRESSARGASLFGAASCRRFVVFGGRSVASRPALSYRPRSQALQSRWYCTGSVWESRSLPEFFPDAPPRIIRAGRRFLVPASCRRFVVFG